MQGKQFVKPLSDKGERIGFGAGRIVELDEVVSVTTVDHDANIDFIQGTVVAQVNAIIAATGIDRKDRVVTAQRVQFKVRALEINLIRAQTGVQRNLFNGQVNDISNAGTLQGSLVDRQCNCLGGIVGIGNQRRASNGRADGVSVIVCVALIIEEEPVVGIRHLAFDEQFSKDAV